MKLAVILVLAIAAGCNVGCNGSTKGGSSKGGGTGLGTAEPPTCASQADRIRAMYQAGGALTEVELADDLAMVMKACEVDSARVAPCLAGARSVAVVERECLPTLDDDGSEGRVFLTR